ncbi:Rho GTPase [Basidiobolus ranarum]|uniref:Rho GTPase n=1 Tax=Basidiobolus ranarum TaxID=34480 RepID=A0ABR2W692_9FUNG
MTNCLRAKIASRKLLILGDGACGKTSVLNVFTRGYFPETYEPTVFENYVHEISLDGKTLELSLWDTAGQEDFDRLRSLSYSNTHTILLCFCVESRDSLENIEAKWLDEILEYAPGVKIVLVALKCDLREDEKTLRNLAKIKEKPITYDEGLAMARRIQAARYAECSAKCNRGVYEVFEQTARIALNVKVNNERSSDKCLIL